MENKKTKLVIIIVTILLIACIGVICYFQLKNGKNRTNENPLSTVDIKGTENVKVNSDGVKENTSSELKKEQNLDEIKIKDTRIRYENGISILEAEITNDTEEDIEEVGVIKINIKDAEGNIVRVISTHVMELQKGETKTISASVISDMVNATSVEYTK